MAACVTDCGRSMLQPAPQPALLLQGVGRLPMTIADGHHRYATAVRFGAEIGGAGADHVLALLYEAGTGGLSVLATHRMVKAPGFDVLERAARTFAFTSVATASQAVPVMSGEIGVWTAAGGGRMRAQRHSSASSSVDDLDVSVLSAALPALVGASVDELTAANRISYTQDARRRSRSSYLEGSRRRLPARANACRLGHRGRCGRPRSCRPSRRSSIPRPPPAWSSTR